MLSAGYIRDAIILAKQQRQLIHEPTKEMMVRNGKQKVEERHLNLWV